jgi:electron transfer flavoprotein beta subunit
VLSVTVDITEPRLPTMKEILKASKKPVTVLNLADLNFQNEAQRRMETVSTRAPHQVKRKQIVITGTPEEAAQTLVGYLSKEGIIS